MAFFTCPECGCRDTHKTIECRPARGGDFNRRRRECNFCGHRFTTYESYEGSNPQPPSANEIPRDEVLRREIAVYLEQLDCTELAHVKRDLIEWIDKKRKGDPPASGPVPEALELEEPEESEEIEVMDAAQRFRLGKERQLAVIAAFASLNSRLHHVCLTTQQVANLCNMSIPVARKTVGWLLRKSILRKEGNGELGQPLYSMPKVPAFLPLAGGQVLLDSSGRERSS